MYMTKIEKDINTLIEFCELMIEVDTVTEKSFEGKVDKSINKFNIGKNNFGFTAGTVLYGSSVLICVNDTQRDGGIFTADENDFYFIRHCANNNKVNFRSTLKERKVDTISLVEDDKMFQFKLSSNCNGNTAYYIDLLQEMQVHEYFKKKSMKFSNDILNYPEKFKTVLNAYIHFTNSPSRSRYTG